MYNFNKQTHTFIMNQSHIYIYIFMYIYTYYIYIYIYIYKMLNHDELTVRTKHLRAPAPSQTAAPSRGRPEAQDAKAEIGLKGFREFRV